MSESLIFEHLKNIKGITPYKIIHIEDKLELIDGTKDVCTVTTLYEVFTDENNSSYYIQTTSNTANVVFEADDTLLKESFSEYYEEQNRTVTIDSESIPSREESGFETSSDD